MLQEVLQAALKPEHKEAGLYLEDDEDFVYLRNGSKLPLATFHSRSVAVPEIWAVADTYVAKTIAENMEDYWTHQRCLAD